MVSVASALGLSPLGQAHFEIGRLVAHFCRLSAVGGSVEMIAQSWIRFDAYALATSPTPAMFRLIDDRSKPARLSLIR